MGICDDFDKALYGKQYCKEKAAKEKAVRKNAVAVGRARAEAAASLTRSVEEAFRKAEGYVPTKRDLLGLSDG